MSPSRINKTPHNFTNVGVTLSKYFGDKDNCSFFTKKEKAGLHPSKIWIIRNCMKSVEKMFTMKRKVNNYSFCYYKQPSIKSKKYTTN